MREKSSNLTKGYLAKPAVNSSEQYPDHDNPSEITRLFREEYLYETFFSSDSSLKIVLSGHKILSDDLMALREKRWWKKKKKRGIEATFSRSPIPRK
jgi:hypothetical protein